MEGRSMDVDWQADLDRWLAPFVVAQMLGAMAGAVLVWLNFLPHWAVTRSFDWL